MPHFTLEYSANLDSRVDMAKVVEVVRKAAIETGIFPIGGTRVRAVRCEHFAIADGNPEHGFIALLLRIGEGRDLPTRQKAGEHVFKALSSYLDPVFANSKFALSFDIQINDKDMSWKRNNIHEALQRLRKWRPLPMDKVTPKSSEVFAANRDRVAPLLAKLKAEGIGHLIDGKIVPSISGQDLRDQLAGRWRGARAVARGNAEDIDRAATAAARAFKAWRDMPATMRKKLLHRVADAIEDRADDIAVLECIDTGQAHRFMAKAAIRGAENFRFFADKCAEARDGLNLPSDEHWNISTRRADRPGRRDHAVEYAVHALDLEDRAGAGRRLHRGAQARGMVAGDGRPAGAAGQAGRRARRRAQHRARHRRGGRQGFDRAPRDQGDRLCRRKPRPVRRSWRRARRP